MCEEHSHFSNFKESLFKETGITQRLMPKEWLERIFLQAREINVQEIIPTTMGEPLLYEHFDTFLELCKKHNIKLNLTTNGTIPRKTADEWANLIIPITKDIKFSVNGATKKTTESIMQGLNFENQIKNIRAFSEIRNLIFERTGYYCTISFQLTFLQSNMHEIREIIQLAAELDIDRIKGHHVWTHYKELEGLSFKNSEATINQWNKIVELANNSIQKFKRINGRQIVLENFFSLQTNVNREIPENYECPFLNSELWISATGEISPCCAPANLRRTLGNFGNIKILTFKEILNSSIYTDLVENYKQKPLCKTCNMRKPLY
jgi:MoaA/NifB/PqqE/SkfB family radical SAM enzyme